MRKIALLAAGLLAVSLAGLLAAAPASAALMQATFTGHVSGGTETTDLFGLGAGADLTNQDFTAVFTYDTSLGNDDGDPGFYQEKDGGTNFSPLAPSPILDATLSIDGTTFDIGGDQIGEIVSSTGYDSYYSTQGGGGSMYLYLLYATSPGDLTQPVATTTGTLGAGRFNLYDASTEVASGTLFATTLTIDALAPVSVPEPGTWALLIAGLGLAGAMLRRRRI